MPGNSVSCRRVSAWTHLRRKRALEAHHSNQGILVHQISQHSHLLVQIVLPDFTYPPLVMVPSHVATSMITPEPMLRLAVLLLLVKIGLRETHPRGVASKTGLGTNTKASVEAP